MIDPVLETIESLKRRAREHTNKEIAELFKRRHLTDSTVFYARYSSIIGGLEALATVGLIGLARYTRYIDFAGKILLHRSDWLRRREGGKKVIELETPEKIPTIPMPQDHKQADELEKIRKELHHIGTALDALIKVESRKGK